MLWSQGDLRLHALATLVILSPWWPVPVEYKTLLPEMRDWGKVWFCCLEDHLPTLGHFGRISACTGPAKTALFLWLLAPGFSIPLQDNRGTSSRACGSGVAWWGCRREDEAPLGWGKVCMAAFVLSWPCPPCLLLTKGAELLRPSVCRPFPQIAPLCAVKLLPFPGLFFFGGNA